MRTHFEAVGDFTGKEVVDSWDVFECSKGHKWEETLENRLNIPLPLHFPVPTGGDICPFCLSDFLSTLGRVTITTRSNEVESGIEL